MTLYLHIGRGKSGSSTIQSLARDHAEFMKTAGFSCPLSAHGMPNHGRLAAALNEIDSDRPLIKKFRKDLVRSTSPNIFLSAEALHGLKSDGIARLRWLTRQHEVRILFYVRDYPSWIPSLYAQSTKKGRNVEEIDSFVLSSRRNLSVVARLENWADAFGWEAIRIRPLDADALVGGDLIADLFHALDIDDPPPEINRENVSPHWMTLEVVRALGIAAQQSGITSVDPRSIRIIARLCEACMDQSTPRRTPYLTLAHWHQAADLYRHDMEILGQRVGTRWQLLLPEPQEREFLPEFAAVPRNVRDAIRNHLQDARWSRIDPFVSSVLTKLLS